MDHDLINRALSNRSSIKSESLNLPPNSSVSIINEIKLCDKSYNKLKDMPPLLADICKRVFSDGYEMSASILKPGDDMRRLDKSGVDAVVLLGVRDVLELELNATAEEIIKKVSKNKNIQYRNKISVYMAPYSYMLLDQVNLAFEHGFTNSKFKQHYTNTQSSRPIKLKTDYKNRFVMLIKKLKGYEITDKIESILEDF